MVASTVALVAVLLVRILRFDLVDAAVGAVLLYPHVVFTSEMWSGVMTPETFAGEEFVAEGGRDFVEMANNYVSPVNSFVSA